MRLSRINQSSQTWLHIWQLILSAKFGVTSSSWPKFGAIVVTISLVLFNKYLLLNLILVSPYEINRCLPVALRYHQELKSNVEFKINKNEKSAVKFIYQRPVCEFPSVIHVYSKFQSLMSTGNE